MAAINRTLFPHLSHLSVKHFTKSVLESSRRTLNARYASRISSLQPVFPEKQDELLFEEDSGNEYASVDADFRLFHNKNVKSRPCDALVTAAIEHNEPLANALLKEYREAGIEILLRSEYEELANLSILAQNFDAFLGWLALVPPVGGDGGVLFPKNTKMVKQMSRIRIPFDQMYRLLYLFGRKGWSGPVPNKLVKILAKYTNPTEFTRLLSKVISLHRVAHGSSEEVRWIHAEWRNCAIQEFSNRNDPQTAFYILSQSPHDIVEFDPNVLDVLDHAARRMRYPIPPFALEMIKKSVPLPPKNPLRNSEITRRAFKILRHGPNATNPASFTHSRHKTAILLGRLKNLLTNPHKGAHIDPKSIAFLFYSLLYSPHSPTHPHILTLFRKRIARLGSDTGKVLWATIEVELLLYRADAHSAILYYNQAFLPLNVPRFLRTPPPPSMGGGGVEWETTMGHWGRWMVKQTMEPLPPVPSAMPLRPSAASSMAIWKAAVMLSLRDPKTTLTSRRAFVGEHVYLTRKDDSMTDNREIKVDVSYLTELFNNFLGMFDEQVHKQRTYFSNPFTRIRYFELFLKHYVKFAPEMAAWVMTQIQQRDVPLDHRIWAVYAKSRVDAGDPGFLLRVFELLQRGEEGPLDFSPKALKNWETDGVRWVGGGGGGGGGLGEGGSGLVEGVGEEGMRGTRFTLPSKVLSAYTYGLRQLLHVKAYKEALELHSRIVNAGYREGTSVALDRLVYRMVEELRIVMRDGQRARVLKSRARVEEEMELEERLDLEMDF